MWYFEYLSKFNKLLNFSIYEAKEKTSQYKGVSYDKQTGKWDVRVYSKGQKRKSGGRFNDELDAAKRVNQLCEGFGIPQQNPEISATPNEPYQVTKKTFLFHAGNVRKSEL
jgi:hypothetical protein